MNPAGPPGLGGRRSGCTWSPMGSEYKITNSFPSTALNAWTGTGTHRVFGNGQDNTYSYTPSVRADIRKTRTRAS